MRSARPKFFSYKRKIISILFFTAVVLILLNIAADKIFLGSLKELKELSGQEIDKKFRTAVFNFGLERDWVKKSPARNNGTFYSSYKIDLPADLPVTLILKEINRLFKEGNVNIYSEEEKINGKTSVKISSGDEIKLKAQFRYKSALKRNAGEISFLLLDILTLNEKEDSVLLSSPESFYIVLIPSKSAAEEAGKISRYGKKYALLLNDEIPELKYNFKEGYSEGRLKASVREIIADFPDLKFFIIDDNSALYSSRVFSFVEKEFIRRNLHFYKKSGLESLQESGAEDIVSRFKKIGASREKRNILTSIHDYILLGPEIVKYKKIGCRFIPPDLF
jgi:hypothetical protein